MPPAAGQAQGGDPTSAPDASLAATALPAQSADALVASQLELVPAPVPPGAIIDARRLLAVSPDGLSAVFTQDWDGSGPMSLVRAGGKATVLDLPKTDEGGPGAAAFAPNGTWVAVVDGVGGLWRVDLKDDSMTRLATSDQDLVFGVWLRFDGPDKLIINLVRSSTVPMPTFVASVDLTKLSVDLLTTEGWERGGWPQSDGSLLYATILPEGGALQINRMAEDGSVGKQAEVGIATWMDINASGYIAFTNVDGDAFLRTPRGEVIALGAGATPRFSPDGQHLGITTNDPTTVVKSFTLAGELEDEIQGPYAAWVTCEAGCAP